MATRAIKKFTKNDDLKKLSQQVKDESSLDDPESDSAEHPRPINKFGLVIIFFPSFLKLF